MTRFPGPYSGTAYSLMRMVFAFLYLSHGLTWLFNAFGGRPVQLTPLLTTAGVIECICGALMLMGLFTSWAAFIASGEMAVAYFKVHQPQSFWPLVNHGELAVLYSFLFLYIAARGSGRYGMDASLRRKGK